MVIGINMGQNDNIYWNGGEFGNAGYDYRVHGNCYRRGQRYAEHRCYR